MLQPTLPAGFIAPCLPIKTNKLPSSREWLHEIKHDGFRVIARKDGARVRLYSRPGNDLTRRFPLIVETLLRLRSRSCTIDGEAVACDDNGVTSFNLVRYRHRDESIFLYAFDLIELNGDDLRRAPLDGRKATLEMILAKCGPGINHRLDRTSLRLAHLFDHPVGARDERRRHIKAERLGGLQIDRQLDQRWLFDRKICRGGSGKNSLHVAC
jgi:ATP-dependent DNA ligase